MANWFRAGRLFTTLDSSPNFCFFLGDYFWLQQPLWVEHKFNAGSTLTIRWGSKKKPPVFLLGQLLNSATTETRKHNEILNHFPVRGYFWLFLWFEFWFEVWKLILGLGFNTFAWQYFTWNHNWNFYPSFVLTELRITSFTKRLNIQARTVGFLLDFVGGGKILVKCATSFVDRLNKQFSTNFTYIVAFTESGMAS